MSFDMCLADARCSSRYFLNSYAPPYQWQRFVYLLGLFTNDIELDQNFVLPQILATDADTVNVTLLPPPQLPNGVNESPDGVNFPLPLFGPFIDQPLESFCASEIRALALAANVTDPLYLQMIANASVLENNRIWWLAMLRQAEFCGVNEIFVIEAGGCQTKTGKQSNVDPPGFLIFPSYSFTAVVLLLSGFIFVRIGMFSREIYSYTMRFTDLFAQVTRVSGD